MENICAKDGFLWTGLGASLLRLFLGQMQERFYQTTNIPLVDIRT